ncbi:CBS domain-containing protein [Couchioplanes caeruleus]|uniref:CBS domain-containing protein n=1 Tax=Couchioplanes caeruleus TaxID=56438 RepID=UPI0020C08B80|nr:CBS domain-containing protein [Couchioplanes caeruleus]UQU61875.1 CBS domain-containing protein [Couchioplanes caeruleus]
MRLWRVDDVMTRDVVAVQTGTPYRAVVDLLISRRVSAVPVVTRFQRVVGIVSEADLMHKVEAAGGRPRLVVSRRRRAEQAKAGARTAGDVMTSPVVTVLPSLSVAAAARRMHQAQVKRLPVEDDLGRLIGIVSRGDLLKVHLRTDEDVRRDVVDEILPHALGAPDATVRVEARDGVVTLRGRVHFRSAAERIASLARQVPGVVGVADGLTYDVDDSMMAGSDLGTPFGVA